jgi:hypothetical protein
MLKITLESIIEHITQKLNEEKLDVKILVDTLGKINLFYNNQNDASKIKLLLESDIAEWLGVSAQWNDFKDILKDEKPTKINNCDVYSKHTFLNSWKLSEDSIEKKAKVVSFYSYKGGVGRTTLAILTALKLSQNHKVVLVDLDLEAPGVIYQFFNHNSTDGIKNFEGFLDYWLYPNIDSNDFKNNFVDNFFYNNVSFFPNLYIMPSGKITDVSHYYEKIARANFLQNTTVKMDTFIRLIDEKIEPDIIIFDLRTGITDIGGLLSSNRYSDLEIFVGYPDNQSVIGLDFFIKNRELYSRDSMGRDTPKTLFCYSPAPLDPITQTVLDSEVQKFKEIIEDLVPQESKSIFSAQDTLKTFFTIPYTYNVRPLIRQYGIFSIFKEEKIDLSSYAEIAESIQNYLNISNFVSIDTGSSDENDNKQKIFDELVAAFSDENRMFRFASGAEDDLNTEERIRLNFQPLVDYENVLKDQVFVIVGEKGTGKSALEQVFKNSQMSDVLLQNLKIEHRKNSVVWLSAINETLLRTIFSRDYHGLDSLADLINNHIFWKCYTVKIIENYLADLNEVFTFEYEQQKSIIDSLVDECTQDGVAACNKKYDFDSAIKKLKTANKPQLILAFDYLDSYDETSVNQKFNRQELIKDLVLFFYAKQRDEIRKIFSAKIFVREDILNKLTFDDIGKIKTNHSYFIQLDFYKIMSIVLKRLIQRSETLKEYANSIKLIEQNKSESALGVVVKADKELIGRAIQYIFSEYITSNLAENFISRYLWIGKKINGQQVFNLRVVLDFFDKIFRKTLTRNEQGVINLYKPLSDDSQIYCGVARNWVDDELKIMYKDKAEWIEKIAAAAKSRPVDFPSGRARFDIINQIFPDDIISICKDLESVGILVVEKGDYSNPDGITFNIPEIYRVYFGISKANGLRPCS